MARMAANSVGPVGPAAVPTAVSTINEQLDAQINRSLKDFHNHSKECRSCRSPVRAYETGEGLCAAGCDLCVNITKLLYKKAEHSPDGAIIVQYKYGWEAVDGLIKVICHRNQGAYSNEIDLKRVQQQPRNQQFLRLANSDAGSHGSQHGDVPRGSQYEEDMERQRRAAQRSGSRRSPKNSHLSVYGDPRTSYIDATTARTQADVSPAGSHRSVHFDSHVHVREFEA